MEKNALSCSTVGLIFAFLALVAIFVWQVPDLTGKSADWAAWVQAFGSIAAIGGAAAIARAEYRRALRTERRQAQRDRRLAREDRRRRISLEMSKVDAVVHLCEGVLMGIEQCLNDPMAVRTAGAFLQYCESAQERAKICIEQIEQIPMYESPYSFLAQDLINLRAMEKEVMPALVSIARAIKRNSAAPWPHPAHMAAKALLMPKVIERRTKLASVRRNASLRLESTS